MLVERTLASNKQINQISLEKIAVVIPAYKCSEQIGSVIHSIPSFVDIIIVVDDASPDNLHDKVIKINDTRITYIRHPENKGVGGTMLTGYQKAVELGATILIKMDGDGQMDSNYIPTLILPILEGRADYTKGNRFLHRRSLVQMPKMRMIGNIGLTFLTKLASGYWNIFDPNNGFTAVHYQTLSLINPANIHHRYFFESSLLVELNRLRAVVIDIPMPARYADEESSLSVFRSFFEFPYNLLKSLVKRIVRQYFLYDFTMTSLFLICGTAFTMFGTLWGIYHWYVSITQGIIATTGTVMIAVLPIILGIQLLLQAIVLDIGNNPTKPLQQQDNLERYFPRN